MLHDKDVLSTRQATPQFPWCMANAPYNHHRICHLLLIQPEPDVGHHLYLHLPLKPPDGGYPLPPSTYSTDRADMHRLGVVAGVEQAISLQQHREACLDKVGRDERSETCMEHLAWGTGSLKCLLATRLQRGTANSVPSLGLPPTLRPLRPHLGTTGQELLPWGEVLSADHLPRQHSISQKVVVSV